MAEEDNIKKSKFEIEEANAKLQEGLGDLAKILGQAAKLSRNLAKNMGDASTESANTVSNAVDLTDAFDSSNNLIEQINKKSKTLGGLLNAGKGAALAFATQIMNADKSTTELARGLNLSKAESIELSKGFAAAALNSNDIAINSQRIVKANTELNKQLGTAFRFSSETLKTFSKLTEIVGISAESAASLAFQAQRSSKTFREIEEDTLAASFSLQRQSGVQLNLKKILEDTGKVTGQVRSNLGANPAAIAKAVTAAKLFGAELDDIVASSKALLDFESSIENELKAELITGKQLNLERARALALAGDQEGLANELANQAGSFSEFSKLNVLQQNELAAAFGMQSDQLADILFKQETQGMNAKELRALGKNELADQLEQLDTQEKIALAQEKFQATLADIGLAILPLVEGFGAIVSFIAESKGLVITLTSLFIGLAAAQKTLAILSLLQATGVIFAENAKAGPIIGTIAAVAGIAALAASAAAAYTYVEDGIAPPGGGPFKITDRFGATAVTAAGDGVAVSPNIKRTSAEPSSMQPIVIQNNWDAFAASNGNGRRGLAGTQRLQASPTFA